MSKFKSGDEVVLRIDLIFLSGRTFKKGTKFTILSVHVDDDKVVFDYVMKRNDKLYSVEEAFIEKYVKVKSKPRMPDMNNV